MALSVIVTSYESPGTLRLCLRSLVTQGEAREIVVSDCSTRQPARFLQTEFPGVRFLQFDEVRSVPQLRWAALPLTTGDIVAAVEARCVPSATWCAELLAAHESAPQNPAAGGSVAIAETSSNFDWALYLCEYGAFAPPLPYGPARAISGANLSYKRAALEASADLTQHGEWETRMHERWLRQGLQLIQCGASVTFVNSMSLATAFAQRWYYGRGYAAGRVSGKPLPVRCLFAFAAFALPLLMTARLARAAVHKGLLWQFLRAFGWIVALNTSWSLGEAAGYLARKPPAPKNF
jgi:Glycosyl transferase family 2